MRARHAVLVTHVVLLVAVWRLTSSPWWWLLPLVSCVVVVVVWADRARGTSDDRLARVYRAERRGRPGVHRIDQAWWGS